MQCGNANYGLLLIFLR